MLRSRLITGPLLVLGLIAIVWLDAWSASGDEHRQRGGQADKAAGISLEAGGQRLQWFRRPTCDPAAHLCSPS